MRVIGISKRWRGQKGTQPHPENLIGESLEAQHSKGESLLNYIYIYTYMHIPLSFLALLASFLYFKRLFHHHPRKQRKHPPFRDIHHLFFPPDLFPRHYFSDISLFFPYLNLVTSDFSLMFLPFLLTVFFFFLYYFIFLFTFFEPSDIKTPSIGVSLVETSCWKHLVGSLLLRLQHWTFNKHFHRVIAHSK